jgi:hypothetical protein
MPNLTRHHHPGTRDSWTILYDGDICVGWVGRRTGVAVDVDQWGWNCGLKDNRHLRGSAPTFEAARAAFEEAWHYIFPTLTESDFESWRYDRNSTLWKHRMWELGLPLPTETRSGQSKCFCGATIDTVGVPDHVRAFHNSKVDAA